MQKIKSIPISHTYNDNLALLNTDGEYLTYIGNSDDFDGVVKIDLFKEKILKRHSYMYAGDNFSDFNSIDYRNNLFSISDPESNAVPHILNTHTMEKFPHKRGDESIVPVYYNDTLHKIYISNRGITGRTQSRIRIENQKTKVNHNLTIGYEIGDNHNDIIVDGKYVLFVETTGSRASVIDIDLGIFTDSLLSTGGQRHIFLNKRLYSDHDDEHTYHVIDKNTGKLTSHICNIIQTHRRMKYYNDDDFVVTFGTMRYFSYCSKNRVCVVNDVITGKHITLNESINKTFGNLQFTKFVGESENFLLTTDISGENLTIIDMKKGAVTHAEGIKITTNNYHNLVRDNLFMTVEERDDYNYLSIYDLSL